jgi:hypothetical protein
MADHTLHLTALEGFYLTLLKAGSLPNHRDGCPEIALTKHLLAEARKQWPLRHLTAKALGFFLRAQGCQKFRTPTCNGWQFKPLREAREFWERRHYGSWRWPEPGDVEWGSQCSTSSTLSTCSKGTAISFDDVLGEAAASVLSRPQDRPSRQ